MITRKEAEINAVHFFIEEDLLWLDNLIRLESKTGNTCIIIKKGKLNKFECNYLQNVLNFDLMFSEDVIHISWHNSKMDLNEVWI